MKLSRSILFIFLAMAVIGLSACDNRTPVGETGTMDWAKYLELPKADFAPDEELSIVTLYDSIPQDIFDLFTRTYGTKIVWTKLQSNEEMFDLLQNNPDKYDLLTPSDYMVSKMIKNGLLYRLDHARLPNIEHIDEDLRRIEYDRGLIYCVPLLRASLGIAFNIDYISGIPRNAQYIVKQLDNDYISHRAGITKEMRFAMGTALMLLGYSPNTTDPREIIEARDLLIGLVNKNGLVLIGVDSAESLIRNDILLGVVWNGIAAAALHYNLDIRFLLPEGRILVAIDSAVISAQSKRIRTAELFANYLLIPQVMARMTNHNRCPNSVSASLAFVDRVIHNGPGFLFPEEEDRLFLKDLGENIKLYEDAWALVLQAKPPETLVKLPLPKGGFFRGDTQTTDFTKQFSKDLQTE